MVASLLNVFSLDYLLASPLALAFLVIQIWMFIDAVRRREWLWAFFIFIGSGIAAIFYYFFVYRTSPSLTRGFELPGAHDRRRTPQFASPRYQ